MKEFHVIPNGGINTYDSSIQDNQLADGKNVWYKGSLRQRDGISKVFSSSEIFDIYPRDGSCIKLHSNSNYGIYIIDRGDNSGPDFGTLWFYDGTNKLELGWVGDYNVPAKQACIIPTPKTEYGHNVLMILSDGRITYTTCSSSYEVTVGSSTYDYTPTIMINGTYEGNGDVYESKNILETKVKQKFTTKSVASDTRIKIQHKNVRFVSAKYIDSDNTEYTSVVTLQNQFDSSLNMFDLFELRRANGELYTEGKFYHALGTLVLNGSFCNASAYNMVNNFEVIYEFTEISDVNTLSACTMWSYFGGDRQGLSSGNRIFLAGSSRAPNRIWWSASNNPFYFPADNYNDIGDSSPILALAKVFDSLIVFKANATYRIKYAYDDETYMAYFPVTEISSSYGCDMPNSIQLINNDLVWCHSKHGVLLLKSTISSVADERVIRKISRNINSMLFAELGSLENHCSLDYDGYYYLFVNNKVILWDYNTTPYSYQNSDDEQKRLAWYFWEIPIYPVVAGMATLNGEFIAYLGKTSLYQFTGDPSDNVEGTDVPFTCFAKTKAYDLGHKEVMKKLVGFKVYGGAAEFSLGFYNNGNSVNKEYGTVSDKLLCGIPFKAFQKFLQVRLNATIMDIRNLCFQYEIGKIK